MYQATNPKTGINNASVQTPRDNQGTGALRTEINAHILTASAINTQSPTYSITDQSSRTASPACRSLDENPASFNPNEAPTAITAMARKAVSIAFILGLSRVVFQKFYQIPAIFGAHNSLHRHF